MIKDKTKELQMLLKEFKDVFAWIYKDLKGIPPKLVEHKIELDTSTPPAHQARSRLNPNYVRTDKQNIDNLLIIGFIQLVEESYMVITYSGSA